MRITPPTVWREKGKRWSNSAPPISKIVLDWASAQLISSRLSSFVSGINVHFPFDMRGAGALSGDVEILSWAEYEFVVPRIKLLRRTP